MEMTMPIHQNYDQLTEIEREHLDNAMRCTTDYLVRQNVPFDGCDQIERAVDAMALAIINARPPSKDAKVIEVISDKPRGSRVTNLLAELSDAGLEHAMELAIITRHEYETEKQRRTEADMDAEEAAEANADALADTGAPDSATDERTPEQQRIELAHRMFEAGQCATDAPAKPAALPVPPGTQYSRDEAIAAISAALKARGMRYSIKGGRGTSWGWIRVDILPAVYKTLDETGRKAAYRALADAFGESHAHGAISIPSSSAHYREYIERARGLQPTKIAQAYWD